MRCDSKINLLRLYQIQQSWVKIISALTHYMNSREIQNVDINEITEEHIFYELMRSII